MVKITTWRITFALKEVCNLKEKSIMRRLICVFSILLSIFAQTETYIVDNEGELSLGEAIEYANASPGRDTIRFDTSEWYPVPHPADPEFFFSDTIVISDDLEIINTDKLYVTLVPYRFEKSIMHIMPGVKVLLIKIAFRDGRSDKGAGLYVGTGAVVELEGCDFVFNTAAMQGGAIYNDGGTVIIRNSSIGLCSAGNEGGGIYNNGGVIKIYSEMTDPRGAFIIANSAGARGGSIYINGGSVTMEEAEFYSSSKAPLGDAIYLASGSLQVFRCTFYATYPKYQCVSGGGLFIAGGHANVVNSVFFNNPVKESGGGIAVQGGVTEIINCTITENQAGSEDSMGAGAGIYVYPDSDGICRIGNSIVAGNTAIGGSSPDVFGPFESFGHNLIGVVDGALGFGAEGDLFGTILQPLDARLDRRSVIDRQIDGVYYQIGYEYPLLRGSPALNAGDNGLIRAPWFEEEPFVDISGRPRIIHTRVDIGSSEASYTGYHKADYRPNFLIDLSEVLRVIQFYNSGGFHCAAPPETSEDGYVPGPGVTYDCAPHNSDYNPQDWSIDLTELLRLVQFYNTGVYYPCSGSEDGFCPEK